MTAPVAALPLVRRIAEHAYKAGAGLVTPILSDEEIDACALPLRRRTQSFDRAAGWLYEGMAKAFAANTARLAIVGDNPMLLSGEDPAKVARANKANSMAYQPALEKIAGFDINWNIVAYPSPAWAKQVFPGRSPKTSRWRNSPTRSSPPRASTSTIRSPPGTTHNASAARAHRLAERPALPRAALSPGPAPT